MRFAKIGEEVFLRFPEISCEEFRLYAIIVFHTFTDTGLCRMTLRELATLYSLDYDNLTRRFKTLRTKNWLEKTRKGIRPLVGVKTVIFTVSEDEKTVNSTVPDCKNYSKTDKKTVKFTVPLIPFKEPFKEPEIEPLSRENESEKLNGHKSQFSLAECFAYAKRLKDSGSNIRNLQAYAMALYKSGESDLFIKEMLDPENMPEAENKLADGLKILQEMQAEGFEIEDCRKFYTQDEWQWLMNEMTRTAQN